MRTRVRKQPIIALNFKSETILKFYNLEACKRHPMAFRWRADDGPLLVDFYQLKNVRVGPPLTKLSGVAHVIPTQILSMHMLSIVKK